MSQFSNKIKSMGIELTNPPAPVANYVGFVKSGNLLSISGQLPLLNGKLAFIGKVGQEISVEDANRAARICAINVVSQLNAACDGDLDRVVKCVKLGIFVNSVPDFKEHPQVANGASDLIADIFGDAGKHSRAAVGSASLPFGVPVEVDALFEIES
jgi:enamine deaminase RidA (YjgF/YER057c/UK114 family)